MPRARHQVDAEALEVVDRVGRRRDLQLAPVAAAGVDLAHVERAAEPAADPLAQTRRPIPSRLGPGWVSLADANVARPVAGVDVERCAAARVAARV